MLLQQKATKKVDIELIDVLSHSIDENELIKFSQTIINPIKQYDIENHSELYITLESFILNDGNYKKVADMLFQHENTIRYRIKKVKSILQMEDSNIRFIESTSIAIKVSRVIQK